MICLDITSLRVQNCHVAYLPATNSAQGTHSTSGHDEVERWANCPKQVGSQVLPPKALKPLEVEINALWKWDLYVQLATQYQVLVLAVHSWATTRGRPPAWPASTVASVPPCAGPERLCRWDRGAGCHLDGLSWVAVGLEIQKGDM